MVSSESADGDDGDSSESEGGIGRCGDVSGGLEVAFFFMSHATGVCHSPVLRRELEKKKFRCKTPNDPLGSLVRDRALVKENA